MNNKKLIIFERPDGGISITAPVRSQKIGEEIEDYYTNISKRVLMSLPPGTKFIGLLQRDEIPKSRYFRNQWKINDDKKIEVDMEKAREHKMAIIRAERNRRLDNSDKLWNMVQDVGSDEDKKRMKGVRQALRDVPQNINLGVVQTAEELEKLEPDWPE